MDVTDQDIDNLRRVSDEVFGDTEYLEVVTVKDTSGDVMVCVKATDEGNIGTRNAFAGSRLRKFHDAGYVAVAVGGGNERMSAWFERVEALEFGDPEPEGQYELGDGWTAVIGDAYAVLKKNGHTVAYVERDGWRLDEYTLQHVLPAKVANALEDAGFERGLDE